MVDLLALNSLDQPIFIIKIPFTFLLNLNVEINCTEPSPSVGVPAVVIERT